MPRGSAGPATGFAARFANYVHAAMKSNGWSQEALGDRIGRSADYVGKRVRREAPFTSRDIEMLAVAFDTGVIEMIARADTEWSPDYPFRMVPVFKVVEDASDPTGRRLYQELESQVPLLRQAE